ncbi:hypothetical protein HDU79_008501 [Rhizoclosmatium sp. JEL0117]|nr:hypothetical protein HDU79_008501 [Rhizoclosmatium sp. JEL0117]
MIAQEAKEKDILAKEKGIAAYSLFERKKRLPKPNMRFLNNLVQQTDSHNYDLILQENKRSRELLEDIERRKASSSRDYRRQSRNRSRSKSRSRSRSGSRERTDENGTEMNDETNAEEEERIHLRKEEEVDHLNEKGDRVSHPTNLSDDQVVRRLSQSACIQKKGSTHKKGVGKAAPLNENEAYLPLNQYQDHDSFRVSSSTTRQIRGRGAVLTSSSRLDKFFGDPTYDPRLDMDNYDDTNLDHFVNAIEEAELAVAGEKRKRKEAKEKKKDKKSKKAKKKKEKKEKKRRKEEEEGEAIRLRTRADVHSDDEVAWTPRTPAPLKKSIRVSASTSGVRATPRTPSGRATTSESSSLAPAKQRTPSKCSPTTTTASTRSHSASLSTVSSVSATSVTSESVSLKEPPPPPPPRPPSKQSQKHATPKHTTRIAAVAVYSDEDVDFGPSSRAMEPATPRASAFSRRSTLVLSRPTSKNTDAASSAAAATIQAAWRAKKARQRLALLTTERRESAALVIQRAYSRYRYFKQRTLASIKIQAVFRMHRERSRWKSVRRAVNLIQSIWSVYLKRKQMNFVHMNEAKLTQNDGANPCEAISTQPSLDIYATKIQSMWRMHREVLKFQIVKYAVSRIKSNFKQRKQRLLQEKLEKLAFIKAQKLLLLQKQKIVEEFSSSQLAIAAEPDVSQELVATDMENVEETSDLSDEKGAEHKELEVLIQNNKKMDSDILVPASPPAMKPSAQNSAHLSLLAPPPTFQANLRSVLTASSLPLPSSPAIAPKSPKHVSMLPFPQRRTARKPVAVPVTVPVTTTKPLAKSSSSNTQIIRNVFCKLDTMTPKEVERLTFANTTKNCGHMAVTLRVEVVKMNTVRPPSPTLEQTRQNRTLESDPHYSIDPSRKTNIKWNQQLSQDFPLPPSDSVPQQLAQKSSCLRKTMQQLKVMDAKSEVVVVKRLEYLEEDGPVEEDDEVSGGHKRTNSSGGAGGMKKKSKLTIAEKGDKAAEKRKGPLRVK